MLILFLNAFMGASLNIALPQIAEAFALSAIEGSWVVMAFLLATAMFMLPLGKLADQHGRRKVFLWGNISFALTSLACAFTMSGAQLIVARFAQGIAGAMLMSTGMAIVTAAFAPQVRGRMLGMAVSSVYIGLTAAPVLAGFMTQVLGWRSIFIFGAAGSTLAIAAVMRGIKTEWKEEREHQFDWMGSLLYILAVGALMLGFPRLPSLQGIVATLAGLLVLGGFILYENQAAYPVLNTRLFRHNRTFAFSNLAALINYAATFAITFILSLYLQYARGLSPADAGLLLITQPAVMALTATYAGKLSDRIDPRILASAGMLIIVAGLIALSFITPDTSNASLVISLLVVGLGFGAFSSPNTNSVMSSVEKKHLGIASATISTMRVMGQILSMAIAAMVFHIFLGNEKISQQNIPALMQSAKVIFVIFAILCFIGVFASLARNKRPTSPSPKEP